MKLEDFNSLSEERGLEELLKCCSSQAWAKNLIESRPYLNLDELAKKSDEVWWSLKKEDWLEAFDGHPKIGDVNSLKEKYKKTKSWAGNEQAGMDKASEQIIQELSKLNNDYERKYGYIFIVCATGKSASEMLDILKGRMNNQNDEELKIAAEEQNKITRIRLEKLL